MKRHLVKLCSAMVVAVGLATGVARAQSPRSEMSFNIPFEFNVGGCKVHGPGTYVVTLRQFGSGWQYFVMRATDGPSELICGIDVERKEAVQQESKLVFRGYGSQYFLAEIWVRGEEKGHHLPRTKQERALAKELARAGSGPETLVVAAKLH